jgi:hypothetical protein
MGFFSKGNSNLALLFATQDGESLTEAVLHFWLALPHISLHISNPVANVIVSTRYDLLYYTRVYPKVSGQS